MMEVIALQNGFYGSYRKEGDTFDVEAGEKASWFVPIEKSPVQEKTKSATSAKTGKSGDSLV